MTTTVKDWAIELWLPTEFYDACASRAYIDPEEVGKVTYRCPPTSEVRVLLTQAQIERLYEEAATYCATQNQPTDNFQLMTQARTTKNILGGFSLSSTKEVQK